MEYKQAQSQRDSERSFEKKEHEENKIKQEKKQKERSYTGREELLR